MQSQQVELFKTVATYVIALVVLIGGGVLLIIPSQVPSEQLLPFLTGIVGAVVAYTFGQQQTAQVQKGNGLERSMLESLHRRLDTVPGVPTAPSDVPTTSKANMGVDSP